MPADTVISQNPTAGTEVAARLDGAPLRLDRARPRSPCPTCAGLTVDEATACCPTRGSRSARSTEVDDPETEKGKIIDSNPGAQHLGGARHARSPCASAAARSQVPNVVGKSQNEAERLLADANLQAETDFRQTSSVPEGRVVEQDPADGTVEIGGTVKIVVAQKPAPTVTPTTVTPTPTPTPTTPTDTTSPSPSASADALSRHRDARLVAGGRVGRSAGGDDPGDAGGVVDERAQPGRALHGIRHPAQLEPVGEHPVAAVGQHRLGVELHAVQRQRLVADGHDDARLGPPVGDAARRAASPGRSSASGSAWR